MKNEAEEMCIEKQYGRGHGTSAICHITHWTLIKLLKLVIVLSCSWQTEKIDDMPSAVVSRGEVK